MFQTITWISGYEATCLMLASLPRIRGITSCGHDGDFFGRRGRVTKETIRIEALSRFFKQTSGMVPSHALQEVTPRVFRFVAPRAGE
jgi:hypothetical protein